MEELTHVMGVDLGSILSVRPVLSTVSRGGLTLQLASLEHHEGGLIMVAEVRAAPGVATPMGMARVSVTDDVGTAYRASAQGQGSSPGQSRLEITTLPVPPPMATRLALTIERFVDPFGGLDLQPVGPWTFEVSLD
jgi:hypothetical protein